MRVSSNLILPEIFKVVDDEHFVPIAFTSSKFLDYFFVHNQGAALKKLFDARLRVFVDKKPVDLMVHFGVSVFREKMLTPKNALTKAIAKSMRLITPFIMSLSHIARNSDFNDMKFSLCNKGNLMMMISQLNESKTFLRDIHTLHLGSNEISTLQPFQALNTSILKILDIEFNKIEKIEEFSYLKHLPIVDLKVMGNPVTKIPSYTDEIRKLLPRLIKIDSENLDPTKLSIRETHDLKPQIQVKAQSDFGNGNDRIKHFNANPKVITCHDVDAHLKRDFLKYRNNSWNKIVIDHKDKISKASILKAMNKQFFDKIPFFPCYYERSKNFDSFFLYRNFDAIRCLIHNNLVMKIPSLNCEVTFEIQLNCAEFVKGQINWEKKLCYVVKNRIKDSKLCLENFASDIDLIDLSVSLSTSFCINLIFEIAQDVDNKITCILLQNNNLSHLNHQISKFPCVEFLDLSMNNIKTFENFPKISTLIEISLDKNPICGKYYDEPWKFVKHLVQVFPNLQTIDERKIDKDSKTVFSRNFLLTQNSFMITESFIKFFFELYDSNMRKSLNKLYDNNSLFTISDLKDENSRNLLNDESFSEKVFVGCEQITSFFESQPKTTHDFTTFCVDVPLTTERSVLITVNGFFKNSDDVIRGFTRTFYLERENQKKGTFRNTFKYRVKNETLTITGVSPDEAKHAFAKTVVTEAEIKKLCQNLLPTRAENEDAKVFLLKDMTHLKENWCKRFVHNLFCEILNVNFLSDLRKL